MYALRTQTHSHRETPANTHKHTLEMHAQNAHLNGKAYMMSHVYERECYEYECVRWNIYGLWLLNDKSSASSSVAMAMVGQSLCCVPFYTYK